MRKILFVLHTSEQTGAPMSVYNLVKALDRERFVPVIALPSSGIMEGKFLREGLEVHTFGVARFGKKEVLRLALFVAKNRVSLVHASSLESYAGCVAGRLTLKPVVWHIHEMLDTYISRVRPLLPLATKVVAVSQKCADAMVKFVSRNKIKVIYNGIPVDDDEIQRSCADFRTMRGIDADAPLVVSVGNIWPGKGYEYLIEAAKIVVDSFPKTRFLIVGKLAARRFEEYESRLTAQIHSLNLDKNVEFIGFVDELAALLSSASLVVSSSVQESFGMGLLEAMAHYRPVVATDTGGVPEVVANGETGLLVPPRDARALGLAISRILGDFVLARTLGQNGRKRMEELFRVERMAQSFENLYAELLGKE